MTNWYLERAESLAAPSKAALYPTPGVEERSYVYPTMLDPGAPVVITQGTAGATTYGYKVAALLGDQTTHTASSAEGTVTTGNAVLDGTNFNRLSWAAVANASTYNVYRTTGGASPPVRIASGITATTFDDVGGAEVSATPFVANNSGGAFAPSGKGRVSFFEPNSSRWFVVIGTLFIELSDWTATVATANPRGQVFDDGLPATMISDGDVGQIVVAAGGNGYLFDLTTNVFTAIAALAGIASKVAYMDGFGLVLDANTSTIYQSDLLDLSSWDPTNFIQRNDQTDPWVSLDVATPYVWALGKWTGIAYYDAGLSPVAFLPHPSGKINFGCAARFSPAVVNGSLVFLAATKNGQGQVIRLAGFTPEVISTFALQNEINDFSRIDDAIGDSYDELGHTFYNLTFPTGGITWSWDAQSQDWHKRGHWLTASATFEANRPLFHAFAFGKHAMLDRLNSNIYEQSASFGFDVDGDAIVRERVPPALVKQNRLLFLSRFEVWFEPGLGLQTGQGSDPLVMMQMSKDGGKTYGNELTCGSGEIGQFWKRVYWSRLGHGRMLVPKIRVSDPVPQRVMGAFIEIEAEAA